MFYVFVINNCYEVFAIKQRKTIVVLCLIVAACTSGCGAHVYHVVERGETLYSIGWLYGFDYRTIAKWNDIDSPYRLQKGQRLRVASLSGKQIRNTRANSSQTNNARVLNFRDDGSNSKLNVNNKNTSQTSRKDHSRSRDSSKGQGKDKSKGQDRELDRKTNTTGRKPYKARNGKADKESVNAAEWRKSNKVNWSWPTRGGRISQMYDAKNPAKQGMDITGTDGQAIYSASLGKVVYSGDGLPRYGNLIIIKHSDTFLSAYAHNKRLLVKEGDVIKARQKIAEMGSSGVNSTRLHFEIRRNGRPVNPLRFLPKQMP